MLSKIRYYCDWLFRDLTARRGKYVIAEIPNFPLLLFMISIVLTVLFRPGIGQKTLFVLAFGALIYWGYQEWRGGRSRFRKLLGLLAMIFVVAAVILFLT